MTSPPSNAGGPPTTLDGNKEVDTKNKPTPSDNESRFLVKCPPTVSLFHDPEARFPDVTPEGTEMSASEKDAAKESAKESWMVLKTSKVTRGDN